MVLKVFEAFAGYGSQSIALDRIGIPYEVVGISEINNISIVAYNALHGHTRNFGDISKIDWCTVSDFDFFTYSFPCTDISKIGDQAGFKENAGTNSSLLWECRKAIIEKKPKWCLMENVRELLGEKFNNDFEKWKQEMEGFGYNNYVSIINASDFIPQNRSRVFMVSIRKDIDDGNFKFPEPSAQNRRLEDFILDYVPSKKYLNGDRLKEWLSLAEESVNRWLPSGTEGRYVFSHSRDSKGKIVNWHKLDIAHCCTTGSVGGGNVGMYVVERKNGDLRVRNLTAFEQMRLMGLYDDDIKKLYGIGLSSKQIADLGGNSIVIDVLCAIYNQIWHDTKRLKRVQRVQIYQTLF